MKECYKMKQCPLMEYCQIHSDTVTVSVEGIIHLYCQGEKRQRCVRLQLLEEYGEQAVPNDMMPNGFPLPGADRESWSEEARNYRLIFR